MSKSEIDASGLNPKTLAQVIDNPDVSKEYLEELADDLEVARSFRKWKDMDEAMREVSHLANAFGVEPVLDPDNPNKVRYWGDTRGIYINMGDQYAATLIYDVVDHEYYVTDWETYVLYVESQQTPVWEIPITIEDEVGHVFTQGVWVKAETLEDALEYLIEMHIAHGDEEIWGDDDAFDPGSVETTEGRTAKPENQMWYMMGIGEEDEDNDGMPESLTKALTIQVDRAEQVTQEDVRYPERFFNAVD